MKQLFLEDLKDKNDYQVREHIITEYSVSDKLVNEYDILIAYESVGDYGCDSSSFFLLKNKSDNKYYEVHASHCSCNGFEDQFDPKISSVEYLKSDKFYLSCGGYDTGGDENEKKVKEYIREFL